MQEAVFFVTKLTRDASRLAVYPGKDADVVDEAVAFFRANVLFRKFDIHGKRHAHTYVA